MARLTVEDCLPHVENRFDLVLKAAKRSREIERGASPLVQWDNDKPTVLALREIAGGLLDNREIDITEQATAIASTENQARTTEIDEFIAEEMQAVGEEVAPEAKAMSESNSEATEASEE